MDNKISINLNRKNIEYNPYDLINILINDKPMVARPYAFDSDIVNQKTMRNAFGNFVKPTKASTSCPDCGQGIDLDLILEDPPFGIIRHQCKLCHPDLPPIVNPFINPFETNDASDINLINHDFKKSLNDITDKVVLATIKQQSTEIEQVTTKQANTLEHDGLVLTEVVKPQKPPKPSKPPKPPKPKQKPELNNEMGEELDINDSDMIENI